jgi:hypothetical protein
MIMMNRSRISAFEPISRQLQKINGYDSGPRCSINRFSSTSAGSSSSSSVSNDKVSILTLDEQIRQLEQTLVNSDDDDDDDDDDAGGDDDDDKTSGYDVTDKVDHQDFIKVVNTSTNFQLPKRDKVTTFKEKSYKEQRDENGRLVKLVSKLDENDRIEPLPKSLLPSKKCNFVSLTGNYSNSYSTYNDYSKKRVRFDRGDNGDYKGDKSRATVIMNNNNNDDNDNRTSQEPLMKAKDILEMEESIRIMLSQYQPVSTQEKVPFYCRICKIQSKDMESFIVHKRSDYHNLATKMERNLRYCKHCDKEFTSPDQLKGHMEGKGHKEQVQRLAARKRYNYHAE